MSSLESINKTAIYSTRPLNCGSAIAACKRSNHSIPDDDIYCEGAEPEPKKQLPLGKKLGIVLPALAGLLLVAFIQRRKQAAAKITDIPPEYDLGAPPKYAPAEDRGSLQGSETVAGAPSIDRSVRAPEGVAARDAV
jgi:hypothetical protein